MKHDCDSAETAASRKVAGSERRIGARVYTLQVQPTPRPARPRGALLFLA